MSVAEKPFRTDFRALGNSFLLSYCAAQFLAQRFRAHRFVDGGTDYGEIRRSVEPMFPKHTSARMQHQTCLKRAHAGRFGAEKRNGEIHILMISSVNGYRSRFPVRQCSQTGQ